MGIVRFKRALVRIVLIFSLGFFAFGADEDFTTEAFRFQSSGLNLSAIISRPQKQAKSIVIIVHGYGRTNVVEQNWYYETRSKFTAKGISVLVWDKPGCGQSEGEFDINQPVESSADEVVAAMQALKQIKEPGSNQIGLYGGSRAGWIAPLAIQKEPSVAFWICISGTDNYENWGYLLRSNLEIAGYAPPEIETLYQGWIEANRIFRNGASYETYTDATKSFWSNEFVQKLTNRPYVEHEPGSEGYEQAELEYLRIQEAYMAENHVFDEESGLEIIVPDFDQVLQNVSCPVLAIFGGKDKHVDWRKTKSLYERTMGEGKDHQLTTKVFPKADHNMKLSKTGGFFESQTDAYWQLPHPNGYYESMTNWLSSHGFGD